MRIVFVFLAVFCVCAAADKDLGDRVWVSPLSGDIWRVRSVSPTEGFGDVESNALVIAGAKESVLIDTPMTEKQTAVILDWAESQLKKPVRHLIATHWHGDRLGGVDVLVARGAATYGLGKTMELAKKNGRTPPVHELKAEQSLTLAGVRLEVFYPGHGHTPDNIVVWLPREKVLHGGCFVKDASSKGLGFVDEMDAAKWKVGVEKTRKRYPAAVIVVPGHGDLGGLELLTHTSRLLEAALQ